jgi:protoheme IX farnesyltransferase
MQKTITLEKPSGFATRLHDYAQLTKMRLASLVVFSAAMTYLMAPGVINWSRFILLIIGGFLVTGSANGFNQIIEKDLDKLMDRTANRPLPDGRLSLSEAMVVCSVFGAFGVFILTYYMNFLSGLLGLLAIVLYAMVYTPLKRKTPLAVFVGAIPGAIPVMLGWVAATGHINIEGWVLFSIQFLWQFPHFWAIAWVLDDDYKKAGFNLLPTGKRDKGTAVQTLIYTFSLIPLGLLPYLLGMSDLIALMVVMSVSVYFFTQALQLYRKCDIASARSLMIGSFLYLPIVQIVLVLNKI